MRPALKKTSFYTCMSKRGGSKQAKRVQGYTDERFCLDPAQIEPGHFKHF